MAATPGATGGSSPVDPPSASNRSDRILLTGNFPNQAPSDLVRISAAADSLKGSDRPDASTPGADHGLQSKDPIPSNPTKQPTYATTVSSGKSTRPPPAFVSNLTTFHPVKRGNASFLKMPADLYQRRLSAFTYALIGRIFLPKQSTPRPLPDLKSELQQLFQTTQDWSLTPLGKGFFSLKFASQGDHVRALRFSSWKLKLGTFFLREWKPNFDPYKEQTSITQLWVRLFHLPEEYWDPNFLVGIFRAVGNVVKLDGSTAAGTVGHFARALVEVDLSYPLAESVTIEGCSSTFVVEFGFENLPLYCSFCRYIGHSIVDCKSKKKKDDPDLTKDNAAAKDPTAKTPANTTRRPNARTRKGQAKEDPSFVPTGNAYTALAEADDNDAREDSPAASTHNEALEGTSNVNHVRDLVPLSDEAAKALDAIKNRDFSVDSGFAEDILSDEAEDFFDERQGTEVAASPNHVQQLPGASDGVLPDAAVLSPIPEPESHTSPTEGPSDKPTLVDTSPTQASNMQQPLVASDGTSAAVLSDSAPRKDSHSPKEGPTDQDGFAMVDPPSATNSELPQSETTMVVPPPAQVADNKMSAAAKRRTKEALRKTRVKSSMKTRSSFDISSDKLHVLADKRGKSVQVPADEVGQPYGPHPKQSQLEDKLRTAVEQGKRPTAYVLDTGQSGALKAMEFIAKQRWGDVLDIAKSDNDIYDLTS